MENGKLLVLAVCDGGVVISSMMANKIEALLLPLGNDVSVVSLLPISVESFLKHNPVDFIVSSSIIPGEIDVPVFNGLPLLTGFKEQSFNEDIVECAQEILKKYSGD